MIKKNFPQLLVFTRVKKGKEKIRKKKETDKQEKIKKRNRNDPIN